MAGKRREVVPICDGPNQVLILVSRLPFVGQLAVHMELDVAQSPLDARLLRSRWYASYYLAGFAEGTLAVAADCDREGVHLKEALECRHQGVNRK